MNLAGNSGKPPELFIVVDVEAAGPTPGKYALLSIGACTVGEPRQTFYVELQPDKGEVEAGAMSIHHLEMDALAANGLEPREALQRFAAWVEKVTPQGAVPVFTAFNAPFDWMFVNEYFHRYLGWNPFGHKGLDVKAYFMGLHGVSWMETSFQSICAHYGVVASLTHNAVEDAIQEADLFSHILADMRQRQLGKGTDQ